MKVDEQRLNLAPITIEAGTKSPYFGTPDQTLDVWFVGEQQEAG